MNNSKDNSHENHISTADAILKCCKNYKDKVNVLSPAGCNREVFAGVFAWAEAESKRVIYISSGDSDEAHILKSYGFKKGVVVSCNYNSALYIDEKFDVVIYDEVSLKPMYSKKNVVKVMEKLTHSYGTMIGYSFEKIFKDGEVIFNCDSEYPIVEPRSIVTKVKVTEDIPLNVYEYVKWSINTQRGVFIYIVDKEKLPNVHKSFIKIKPMLDVAVYNPEDKGYEWMDKVNILISDNIQYASKRNIIVYYADSMKFNYKDLIYISSMAGKGQEVLFVCSGENKEIDKCKNLLRELNKRAWEHGLLKV